MRADAIAPRGALPNELDQDDARVVLDALRGGDGTAFDVLANRSGPEPLADLAAGPHGADWADVPRHRVPASPRLGALHAAARMFRFDGSAPHLGGDLAQSLVACLEADDLDWAELAARYWRQWTMHAGEVRTSWPQAASMLGRFAPAIERRPGLLGSLAALAAAAGAPEADELWSRTLDHPMLADHAQRRWELELEWARCHLLLAGGQPARGLTILRRVQGGFGDLGNAAGRLAWTDATLELVCGLAWTGQGAAAVEAFDAALRRVEAGGELEAWIRGAGAYACAVAGDLERSAREAATIDRAVTDTGSLALRALVPARLVRAGHERDRAAFDAAVDDALSLEASQAIDLDAVACWRVHAAEAAVWLAHASLAHDALGSLRQALEEATCTLPVHELRRDHVARQLGMPVPGDLDERARRLGVRLPELPRVLEADQGRIDVSLFGPLTIRRDGADVPDTVWSGRRQARLLLALLLTRDGRVERDDAADAVWGEVDSQTATARINPLLNAIRTALAISGDGDRALVSRGGMIVLDLAAVDTTDLSVARRAADAVEAGAPGMRTAALEALATLRQRPIADLGTGRAAAAIREELLEVARELVPRLAAAWDGAAAPDEVLDAVRRTFEQDPSDVRTCVALLRLLRDRGDALAASEAFHRTRRMLGEELGLTPPLELVRLHAAIIGTGTAPAADRTARRG